MRTSCGACPAAAAPRPSSWATASTCRIRRAAARSCRSACWRSTPTRGKVVWEYKFNLFQSDVPAHRIAWASPAADPETGNIYALSGGAQVIALSPEGKLLWERSFGEEFAAFTTHGGRTMSPVIDGDLVIVSAAVSNWGSARRARASFHRPRQADRRRRLGRQPGRTSVRHRLRAAAHRHRQRHAAADRGLGDGAVYAIKAQTGEKVWSFAAAKRAINTGVVVSGNTVFVSHGDENLDGERARAGRRARWRADRRSQDDEVGREGDRVRILVADRRRHTPLPDRQRLDAESLRHRHRQGLWTQPMGSAQKASPVLADGKLYVGTDGGNFFIVRPHGGQGRDREPGRAARTARTVAAASEGTPEQVLGNVAISRGRIFFVSSDAIYAIGSRRATSPTGLALEEPAAGTPGPPAHLQVSPTELNLDPGQSVDAARAALRRAGPLPSRRKGRSMGAEGSRTARSRMASFTIADKPVQQAGLDQRHVSAASPARPARAWRTRCRGPKTSTPTPTAPFRLGGRTPCRGRLVVASSTARRCCRKSRTIRSSSAYASSSGPRLVELHVRGRCSLNEKRRQMGDIGIIAQRYSLVLYGNIQQLKMESWQPETARTVTAPFAWKPNTWYRPQAARREPARRQGRAQRQGLAHRRSRAGRHG